MDLFKMNLNIWLITIATVLFALPLAAQNFDVDENSLQELNTFKEQKITQINVLQSELNTLLEIIEIEKRYEFPDEDYISDLLAEALDKTSLIDIIEKELESVNEEIFIQRKDLYHKYSAAIDSLKEIEPAGQQVTVNKIKALNAKKIIVSPILTALTFNPDLIERITFKDKQPAQERAIYLNYLNNALQEVDSIIALLNQKSKDIKEMIRLDEMAKDFADDLDNISIGGIILSAETAQESQFKSIGPSQESFVKERTNITDIQQTLQPFVYSNIEIANYDETESFYLEDYLILINETKKTLKLYNEIIYNIIESH